MSKIKIINLRKKGSIYSGFAQCGSGCRYYFIAKPDEDVGRAYRRAKHRDRLQGLISTVQIKGAACIRRCS